MSNKFVTLPLQNSQKRSYHGIPFEVVVGPNGFIQELPQDVYMDVGEKCEAMFFLGMTQKTMGGSEWWGQNERYFDHYHRTYIGDRVARIAIVYEDNSSALIPVIFGVNIWNYNLYEPLKEGEGILDYGGPYDEPFKSDPNARKLLQNALRLMRNEGRTKGDQYILGIKTNPKKKVKSVIFKDEPYKSTGLVISGITGLLAGGEIQSDWILTDYTYYTRREYLKNVDALMRRLYQFLEEVPEKMEQDFPKDYKGPYVKFSGYGKADLYTNVYANNLHDVCNNKINKDGVPTTSTPGLLNFGLYVGFGTYSRKTIFGGQIWSRDIGRVMVEAERGGADDRVRKCCDLLHKYLYEESARYSHPNWKRVANAKEILNQQTYESFSGKENDGHAALMLGIYNAYLTGAVDIVWLKENHKALFDAADWFFWQIDNPELSGFDGVLYSESEASTQAHAGKDLFSNVYAYFALLGYSSLFERIGDTDNSAKCKEYAEVLYRGIMDSFTCEHPRYGRIFTDTIDDCWTYEYKRMAPVFIQSDIVGYDPLRYHREFYEICMNTFLAQKEDYYNPASGRQMGYGQGYLTLSALMLDYTEEYSDCMEYAAMFSYHHTDCPDCKYITPEGVIMHPSGRYWFRNCDLGNAVQQGEIVKCGRLIIGIDDIAPQNGISIIPRLPLKWDGYEVKGWKVSVPTGENYKQISADVSYKRTEDGYALKFSSEETLNMNVIRFGPFDGSCERFNVSGGYKLHLVKEINSKKYVYVNVSGPVKDIELSVTAL